MANDFAGGRIYRIGAPTRTERVTTMQLARVRGNVVASIKASGLSAHKLLLLQAVRASNPMATDDDGAPEQSLYVAIDLAGAGIGEVVLVAFGSAARVDTGGQSVPTDAAVVGIVDSVQVDGEATFVKR